MKRPPIPPDKPEWSALTFRQRWRLFAPVHEFWGALALIGMRDRLRCPTCTAVGTWKAHGTLWSRWRHKDRPFRRWMCKWCGRYEGRDLGVVFCFSDPARNCWVAPYPLDPDSPEVPLPTPSEILFEKLGKVWPWWG